MKYVIVKWLPLCIVMMWRRESSQSEQREREPQLQENLNTSVRLISVCRWEKSHGRSTWTPHMWHANMRGWWIYSLPALPTPTSLIETASQYAEKFYVTCWSWCLSYLWRHFAFCVHAGLVEMNFWKECSFFCLTHRLWNFWCFLWSIAIFIKSHFSQHI